MITRLLKPNVTYSNPSGKWRLELHSTDGTVWTIYEDADREEVLEKANTFAEFSGLPITVLAANCSRHEDDIEPATPVSPEEARMETIE